MDSIHIRCRVNGEVIEKTIEPHMRLIDLLRNEMGLTGVKEGCGKGECGSCTVIMNRKTVHSCLVLAAQADGAEITTIEGLADEDRLHPLQEAFIQKGAVQCGFCTPGFILSAKHLLDNNLHPTREDILKAVSGNLCRCTGYKKIIGAIESAAEEMNRQFEEKSL